MKQRFDIVIAGGGMVGLATAALLHASAYNDRLRITVVDGGAAPKFDPAQDVALRVSALSTGTAALLDTVGAWSTIVSQRAAAYDAMRVWDSRSVVEGPETLRFDAADFAVPELGFIVENMLVRHALFAALGASDVELRFSTGIEAVYRANEDTGYEVRLADNSVLSPDLLIGADGAGSLVRRGAGIPTKAWNYPQSALVTHVKPAEPHRQTAWQRFLQDGPVALLPLGDGRSSVVWSTSPDRVDHCMTAGDAELSRLLTEATDGVLGNLAVAGPKGSFPLRAQHAIRYIEPGLALIGDAAHSVHPLAGQGANLGFADAVALSNAVEAGIRQNEYPGDLPTLRGYERSRRGANATMLHFIDSLNRLFLAESGFLPGLRRRGMRLFNRSGPIRRRAVQVALGINV